MLLAKKLVFSLEHLCGQGHVIALKGYRARSARLVTHCLVVRNATGRRGEAKAAAGEEGRGKGESRKRTRFIEKWKKEARRCNWLSCKA